MDGTMRKGKRQRKPCKKPTGLQWAVAQAEIDRYLNPDRVSDKGYTRLLKGKTFAAHSKYTDLSLAGPLIGRGLGGGFMYRLSCDVGGKPSLRDFFLMVEENQTTESSLWLFTNTPWLKTMLTLIQLRTLRKTPSQKTPYTVSIKSGGEAINVLASHDPINESVLTFRFITKPKETDA